MIWDEEKLEKLFDREQGSMDRVNDLIRDTGNAYSEGSASIIICHMIEKVCGFEETYPMLVIDINRIKEHYEMMNKGKRPLW